MAGLRDDVVLWDRGQDLVLLDYGRPLVSAKLASGTTRTEILQALEGLFEDGAEAPDGTRVLKQFGLLRPEHRARPTEEPGVEKILAQGVRPPSATLEIAPGQARPAAAWIRRWLFHDADRKTARVRLVPSSSGPFVAELTEIIRSVERGSQEVDIAWEVELPPGVECSASLLDLLDSGRSLRAVVVDRSELDTEGDDLAIVAQLIDEGYEPTIEIPTALGATAITRIANLVDAHPDASFEVVPLWLDRAYGARAAERISQPETALHRLISLADELGVQVAECEPWRSILAEAATAVPVRTHLDPRDGLYLRDGVPYESRRHAEHDCRASANSSVDDVVARRLGCAECEFYAMCPTFKSADYLVLRDLGHGQRAVAAASFSCELGKHLFPLVLDTLRPGDDERSQPSASRIVARIDKGRLAFVQSTPSPSPDSSAEVSNAGS